MRTRPKPSAPAVRPLRLPRGGFTVIEVLIASVLLVLALVGFSGAIGSTLRSNALNRERTRAAEGARQTLEVIQSFEYQEIFARFNAEPLDDPLEGPSPSSNFEVFGLMPLEDDPDGFSGEIRFPVMEGAPGVLREDVVDSDLGMPRDLNGDGVIDGLNHAGDYILLPMRIVVTWAGETVNGEFVLNTAIADL